MVRARSRRQEIERWLRQRDRERLTLRELSERSGIPAGTLAWWVHRLRADGRAKRFVEVQLRDELPGVVPGQPLERSESSVCVRLPSGVELTVNGDCAARITTALIEALPRW